MLVPYRKPKRSYVLPVVTTLAVAAPLATFTLSDSTDYRSTTGSELAAIPAQLAEVVLTTVPDITLPLRELTGLNLPDLHLSDLRMLPIPESIPVPQGLPLPPGVELPKEIPLPKLDPGQNAPSRSLPGQRVPGQYLPGQTLPGQTVPGQNTPAQSLPGQNIPGQTLPGQTVPGQNNLSQSLPGQNFPGQSLPGQNIPGQTLPGQTVPGQNNLGQSLPGQNFPGQSLPGQNAPGQTLPGQTVPGQNNPAQSLPGQNIPGQTVPGQSTPTQTLPDQTGPGQSTDVQDASSESPPTHTTSDRSNPGQTIPGQTPSTAHGATPGQPAQGRSTAAAFIADPSQLEPDVTPDTPALSPGAVPPELLSQVGAQVKEVSRDTPFSVVALTAHDLVDTKALVRARQTDGSWGPWYDTEAVDTRRNDRATGGTTGTEPIYVGNTKSVQILVTRKPAVATTPRPPVAGDAEGAVPMLPTPAAGRSDDPAPTAAALTAVLIDPGRGAIDGALNDVAAALPGGGPNVITRSQWGADESIRCEEPTYDDQLGGLTVHHTAGRNDYTPAESAGIVRAIYTYHAKTLGWCDIGYNALVDKYGQIFEGRFGGLDRPVQGAHAGGFNENTSGVALMGNYESEEPSDEAINAIGRFIGWRSKIAGLDPKGYTTMYSEGTEFTPYAQGEAVQLPIVFAHRDVGNTSCPGDSAYADMDRIRDIAAGISASSGTSTRPQQQAQAPSTRQQQTQTDIATLAALTAKLLGMVNQNPIARHWADKGGPDGPLGAAVSEPQPTTQGQQYAKFVNGYAYTGPNGQVFEVMGTILDRFLALGGDAGVLGLPMSDSYAVPNGLRTDFQYGSLVLNQLTGIVSTVWKTYNDTYQQQVNRNPVGQVSAPEPAS
ncbi:N-acetylmuramoyl-L-alanine amidase [Nocardia sp. NPDC052112]|uniref:N-acetylmuramoyl-L-alanine amidase n=1 Tax=Nocardia sp. NPDC052112 TaxID=3155646 RepID=UPI00342DEC47